MNDREQQIRDRAHAIWEENGRPDGQHHEHWHQAEAEVTRLHDEGLPTPDTVSAIDVEPAEHEAPTPVKPAAATVPIKPTRTKKVNA